MPPQAHAKAHPYTRSSKNKAKLFSEIVQFVKKEGTMEYHGITPELENDLYYATFSREDYRVVVFKADNKVSASFFSTEDVFSEDRKIYKDAQSFEKDFQAYVAEHIVFEVESYLEKVFREVVAYVETQSLLPIFYTQKYEDFAYFTKDEGCKVAISMFKDHIYCSMLLEEESMGKSYVDLRTFKKDFEAFYFEK